MKDNAALITQTAVDIANDLESQGYDLDEEDVTRIAVCLATDGTIVVRDLPDQRVSIILVDRPLVI